MMEVPGLRRSLLCDGTSDRHCEPFPESNVFDKPLEPSAAPSETPSASPVATCFSDDDGNFRLDGSGDDASEGVVYAYQVQTTSAASSVEILHDELLPPVERAISDILVAAWFSGVDACSTQRRRLQEVPVTGVESAPPDEVLPGLLGINCRSPLVEGADRCFLIGGGLTVLGPGDLTWVDAEVQSLLQSSMDGGELNDVHPDVVDVRYVVITADDEQQDGVDPGQGPGRDTAPLQSGTRLRATPWVLLSIAVILILVIFAFIMRRSKRKYDSQHGPRGSNPRPASETSSSPDSKSDPGGFPYLREPKSHADPLGGRYHDDSSNESSSVDPDELGPNADSLFVGSFPTVV